MRFLTNPHKPMILALARPDPKKNIPTLLRAFGECRPLRELANLVTNYLSILFSINYFSQICVCYSSCYIFCIKSSS